jgi:hypothetical protein
VTEFRFRPFDALRAMKSHGVRFVVIGGIAGKARGSPLLTNDVDVCYARDAATLRAMAAALRALDATLRGAPADVPFTLDARSLYEGDRFTFDTTAGPLDIMGAPDGILGGYEELDRTADDMELDEGLVVRVAALEDLIRMKRAAGRPKDRAALEILGALMDEIDDQAAHFRAERRRAGRTPSRLSG